VHTVSVPRCIFQPESMCLLILIAGMLLLQGSAPALADDDLLQPGELQIQIKSGYAGYALPIANSALARRWTGSRDTNNEAQWASGGGLSYQLAYDYSTVPVAVKIEHRRPEAFSGRIEVLSAHGFHSSEGNGGNFCIASHEFVAPPSVPVEFCLAPRCCPPSAPGQPLRLLVRLFQRGISKPIREFEQRVIQLEPAHLYSIALDAPDDLVIEQFLNESNRLDYKIELQDELDSTIYSSRHYIFSCERSSLCGQPLAARQFAFVFVSFPEVQKWSVRDQQSLLAYVMGGGRLFVYGAAPKSNLQSVDLRPLCRLGRGILLSSPDTLDAAAKVAASWLEGELAEFVLHAGGRVGGRRLNDQTLNTYLRTNINIDLPYGIPVMEPGLTVVPLSHRSGYLHPLWLKRSASDLAALEPWDYPEFTQQASSLPDLNANLKLAALNARTDRFPRNLQGQLAGDRSLPYGYLILLSLACILCGGLLLRDRSGSFVFISLTAASVLLTGGGRVILTAQPTGTQQLRLNLIDCDVDCPVSVSRTVVSCDEHGESISLELTPSSLVRRIDSDASPAWHQQSFGPNTAPDGKHDDVLLIQSGASRLAVRSDAVHNHAPNNVTMRSRRRSPSDIELEITCPGLPNGQLMVLQSSLGWQALRSSQTAQWVNLRLPSLQTEPGLEHQLDLQRLVSRRGFRFGSSRNPQSAEAVSLLVQLLNGGWTDELTTGSERADLLRLGWIGILQDPLLGRGLPVGQAVLFYALPAEEGSKSNSADWVRLTVDLEADGSGDDL
jgi:hypothetical protein